MELHVDTRSNMVTAVRDRIDAGSASGTFKFYTKDDIFIVALTLDGKSTQTTNHCMVVVDGVGTFTNTSPFLRGVVGVGCGGLANRWVMADSNGNVVATGSCGDPSHTGKNIQFEPTLNFQDYDNITVTSLTFTQPAGSNTYIP